MTHYRHDPCDGNLSDDAPGARSDNTGKVTCAACIDRQIERHWESASTAHASARLWEKQQESLTGWTAVADALPTEPGVGWYLVHADGVTDCDTWLGISRSWHGRMGGVEPEDITHWRELPEGPE